jgi:hypothetical protein
MNTPLERSVLEVRPACDPTGALRLRIDRERGELVVDDDARLTRFSLSQQGHEVGWYREGSPVELRVVLAQCLRDFDAEQAVLELSERAARRAGWDRGCRLGEAVRDARQAKRLPVLPFQRWFAYLTAPERPEGERLCPVEAALRAGYVDARKGHGDTSRLLRRLGLAVHHDGRRGAAPPSQFVSAQTALALCRALDRDPTELGI